MADTHLLRAASRSQLADEGDRIVVEEGEHEILLVVVDETIHAIGNVCTHDEIWLDDGTLHPETCEIECPMHEGRFDLRTGAATHLPCERPVPVYRVVLEGDDVLVEIPAAA